MTTKLTLCIEKEMVKKAKRVAKLRGTSVSKMIEEFISSLPEIIEEKTVSIRDISNKLKENVTIPENINYREFIRESRSRLEAILKITGAHKSKLVLPRDANYNSLVNEWRYEDYIKNRSKAR